MCSAAGLRLLPGRNSRDHYQAMATTAAIVVASAISPLSVDLFWNAAQPCARIVV
jgi:hypothetical protein